MPKRPQSDTKTAQLKASRKKEARREQPNQPKSNQSKSNQPKSNQPKPNQPKPDESETTAAPEPTASYPRPYLIVAKPGPIRPDDWPSGPQTIKATLTSATPDEECPLTLEPITTSQLPFLPDCKFIEDLPHYNKLTLPCGHAFSAVPLIYHMCKNNMLCPICRAGLNQQAMIASIPQHFREAMAAHIASTTTAERRDDEQQTIVALINLQRTSASFLEIASRGRLYMVLTFSSPPQAAEGSTSNLQNSPQTNLPQGTTVEVNLELMPTREQRDGVDRVVFRPRQSHMRMLEQIQGVGTVLSASTFVTIPRLGDLEIEGVRQTIPTATEAASLLRRVLRGTPMHPWNRLARSAVADLSQNQNRQNQRANNTSRTEAHQEVSTFEFGFGQEGESVFVNYVSWWPDMSHITWAVRMEN